MDILKKTIAFLASFKLATVILVLLLLLTFFGTLEQGKSTLFDVQQSYFTSFFVLHEVGDVVALAIRGSLILFGLLTLAVAFYLTARPPRTAPSPAGEAATAPAAQAWVINLWWIGGILTSLGVALQLAAWAGSPTVLPLPGAMILLPLLLLNLLLGGLIRMRAGKSTIGVFIVHIGIVVLLVGSYIEHQWASNGHMTLFEGQGSDEFVSYTDWEVAVVEPLPGGKTREVVIPHERFVKLDGDDTATFENDILPFRLALSGYVRNARPKSVPGTSGGAGGFVLEERPPVTAKGEKRNNRNLAGMYATILPEGGEPQRGILWAGQQFPWKVEVAERTFEVHMRPRRWKLPFDIQLERFVHEVHPGTGMARRFSSYVTKTDDRGIAREVHITMNEPLRSEGYTLYQSGWGPQGAPPGTPLFSTFSVVANPSDRVPLWACVIIGAGLLLHFLRKLVLFLRAQSKRNAAEANAS